MRYPVKSNRFRLEPVGGQTFVPVWYHRTRLVDCFGERSNVPERFIRARDWRHFERDYVIVARKGGGRLLLISLTPSRVVG